MTIPARVRRSAGRYALVDGIPFQLPVDSSDTPALMAAFTVDADRAADMLPGNELHPVRLPGGRARWHSRRGAPNPPRRARPAAR